MALSEREVNRAGNARARKKKRTVPQNSLFVPWIDLLAHWHSLIAGDIAKHYQRFIAKVNCSKFTFVRAPSSILRLKTWAAIWVFCWLRQRSINTAVLIIEVLNTTIWLTRRKVSALADCVFLQSPNIFLNVPCEEQITILVQLLSLFFSPGSKTTKTCNFGCRRLISRSHESTKREPAKSDRGFIGKEESESYSKCHLRLKKGHGLKPFPLGQERTK